MVGRMELNISSSVEECLGVQNDVGDAAAVKLTKAQKKNRRKRLKNKLKANLESIDKRKDTENPLNNSLATTATSVDQKITVSSPAATGDIKSSISGMENDKGNGATKLGKLQRKRMRKRRKKMENNCATTNHSVNGTEEKENKQGPMRTSMLGQISNSRYLESLEAATDGVGLGTIASDTTGSKKRKRQKNEDKNSDLSDVMKICENSQEKVDAYKGLGTTKVVVAISAEMLSDKSAIPDEMGLSTTTNLNVNDTGKKKKKRKRKNKSAIPDEMGLSTTTNLNVNDTGKKKKKRKQTIDRPNLGETLNPQALQDLKADKSEMGSSTTATDTTVSKKRKRKKLKEKDVVSGGILSTSESAQDTIIINKASSGTKTIVEITTLSRETSQESKKQKTVGLDTIKKTEVKELTHVATMGKKLLIIDVNGLLADIVYGPPKDIKADKYISRRAIFKRPFLDDFLRFCFERFNVGIWSSRTKKNLDPVVDFLLGDFKKKVLFCWDASQCTNSGIRTLEDKHKCIVFKDLRKIWDTNGPRNSWVKGAFHESNTLLLDDSPYKALLNTKHTGIFPASYSYKDKDDDFLGPKGKLQTYLEGLAAADDVKTYVEQHPLGQGAIDENSQNWAFYLRVLKGQNR